MATVTCSSLTAHAEPLSRGGLWLGKSMEEQGHEGHEGHEGSHSSPSCPSCPFVSFVFHALERLESSAAPRLRVRFRSAGTKEWLRPPGSAGRELLVRQMKIAAGIRALPASVVSDNRHASTRLTSGVLQWWPGRRGLHPHLGAVCPHGPALSGHGSVVRQRRALILPLRYATR